MYDIIVDQMQAPKINFQRSHCTRLTTEQREEYIQHVIDNRKKRDKCDVDGSYFIEAWSNNCCEWNKIGYL